MASKLYGINATIKIFVFYCSIDVPMLFSVRVLCCRRVGGLLDVRSLTPHQHHDPSCRARSPRTASATSSCSSPGCCLLAPCISKVLSNATIIISALVLYCIVFPLRCTTLETSSTLIKHFLSSVHHFHQFPLSLTHLRTHVGPRPGGQEA